MFKNLTVSLSDEFFILIFYLEYKHEMEAKHVIIHCNPKVVYRYECPP